MRPGWLLRMTVTGPESKRTHECHRWPRPALLRWSCPALLRCLSPRICRGRLSPRIRHVSRNGHRPGGHLSGFLEPWGLQSAHPPSPFDVIRRGTRLLEGGGGGGGGGNVTVCLPLPLSPHPYMVLPVSQSLLVQSVSALCLDYVPGVSSYVSLYRSVLPHVTCGLLLMSACKPVWMSLPVFLCLLRLSFIKYPVCHNPRLLVPGSPCTAPWQQYNTISLKLGIKVDKSLSVSSTQVTTLYVLSLSVSKSLYHLHC